MALVCNKVLQTKAVLYKLILSLIKFVFFDLEAK